jgi:hypothetical protein
MSEANSGRNWRRFIFVYTLNIGAELFPLSWLNVHVIKVTEVTEKKVPPSPAAYLSLDLSAYSPGTFLQKPYLPERYEPKPRDRADPRDFYPLHPPHAMFASGCPEGPT